MDEFSPNTEAQPQVFAAQAGFACAAPGRSHSGRMARPTARFQFLLFGIGIGMIPRRLDRWVLMELALPVLFSVLTFSGLLYGTAVLLKVARFMVQFSPPFSLVSQMLWMAAPGVVVMAVPMAMLLGSILAFGRLSAHQEITAVLCGGVSYGRLMLPVAFSCALVSLGVLWLSDAVVPRFNQQMQVVQRQIRKGKVEGMDRRSVFMRLPLGGGRQAILMAGSFSDGLLKRVSFYAVDPEGRNRQYVTASLASFGGEGKWVFQDGYLYEFDKTGQFHLQSHFRSMGFELNTDPQGLEEMAVDPTEVSFARWRDIIQRTRETGGQPPNVLRQMTVDLHQKIALPFACLAFALLGAPLGMKPQRTTGGLGLGISLLGILGYYVTMMLGRSLGSSGVLPEVLGAWLPNLSVLGAAMLFTWRLSRQV